MLIYYILLFTSLIVLYYLAVGFIPKKLHNLKRRDQLKCDCGEPLERGWRFCPHCGGAIKEGKSAVIDIKGEVR
ncbi:MAG: hypothetical protein ACUVXI_17640 [bacterium]